MAKLQASPENKGKEHSSTEERRELVGWWWVQGGGVINKIIQQGKLGAQSVARQGEKSFFLLLGSKV